MSWVAVAIGSGALGAVTKYSEAKQAQKQDQAKMMANAAQIQYSPWTHANAQIIGSSAGSPTAAALGGALEGGLAGVAMGSANGGFGGGAAAPAAAGGGMNGAAISGNDYMPAAPQSNQMNMGGSQFGRKQTLYGNMA